MCCGIFEWRKRLCRPHPRPAAPGQAPGCPGLSCCVTGITARSAHRHFFQGGHIAAQAPFRPRHGRPSNDSSSTSALIRRRSHCCGTRWPGRLHPTREGRLRITAHCPPGSGFCNRWNRKTPRCARRPAHLRRTGDGSRRPRAADLRHTQYTPGTGRPERRQATVTPSLAAA